MVRKGNAASHTPWCLKGVRKPGQATQPSHLSRLSSGQPEAQLGQDEKMKNHATLGPKTSPPHMVCSEGVGGTHDLPFHL